MNAAMQYSSRRGTPLFYLFSFFLLQPLLLFLLFRLALEVRPLVLVVRPSSLGSAVFRLWPRAIASGKQGPGTRIRDVRLQPGRTPCACQA